MAKKFEHITEMEKIYDRVIQMQRAFDNVAEEYKQIQADVKRLEAYYTGLQWKADFEMDERGEIPRDIKRGVLSEDGINDVLERNKEIMDMLGNASEEYGEVPTYHDVVKRAQDTARARGEYGNKDVILYPCDTWLKGNQINLWTYWQGYQYKDIDEKGIDILLVGQDWGNPEKNKNTITKIEAIQSGKVGAFYNDNASVTDQNLKKLFECLGCNIEKVDPGLRLFFTNYSLGYRKDSEQGGMTKKLLRKDESFFDDLVKVIRPKIIICLGKVTYEIVTKQTIKGFTEQLKKGIPFVTTYPNCSKIKVYGVAHCGALGTNNVGGMVSMIKTWKEIAKDLGEFRVIR